MNADIINLFDHFYLSQRLRHLKKEKQQGVSASLLIVLLCLFRKRVRGEHFDAGIAVFIG